MTEFDLTYDADSEDCIENCGECHRTCLETLQYCIGTGHADLARIKLLTDCAKIAEMAADFMIRGSERRVEICAACAEICSRCAASCAAVADDDQMQLCAESCARCAESCERMAGGA